MKLVEKKCPNCGASLEFNDTDKSCKCSYCHRAFEIERDEDNKEDYNLTMTNTDEADVAILSKFFVIAAVVIGAFAFIFFVFVLITMFSVNKDNNNNIINNQNNVDSNKVLVATNISEFNNTTLKKFESSSHFATNVKGESSTDYSYHVEDNETYKYILAYKDEHNYFYVVSKVLYINFFNKDDKKTVYIPVKFEDVYSNLNDLDDFGKNILDGASVDAPTFYLNSKKSSYIRGGYSDYNQFLKEKVKPLKEAGYEVTEK